MAFSATVPSAAAIVVVPSVTASVVAHLTAVSRVLWWEYPAGEEGQLTFYPSSQHQSTH